MAPLTPDRPATPFFLSQSREVCCFLLGGGRGVALEQTQPGTRGTFWSAVCCWLHSLSTPPVTWDLDAARGCSYKISTSDPGRSEINAQPLRLARVGPELCQKSSFFPSQALTVQNLDVRWGTNALCPLWNHFSLRRRP